MTLDIEDVVTRLGMTLRGLGVGAPFPGSDAAVRTRALAAHAAMIADAYASGGLTDEEMAHELDALRAMTRDYAGALKGLPGPVVEAAARAAQRTLSGALRASLSFVGAPLPRALERAEA